MDYTLIREYYINGSNSPLEIKLRECFRSFIIKSRPLEFLWGKTLAETCDLADSYFSEKFRGQLCFYTENVQRFVVFGFGAKNLDEKTNFGDKIIVMIMGASLNRNKEETKETLSLLKETFNILQLRNNWPIVWNQNRQWKGKALSRIMEKFGAKKLEGNLWIYD